MTRHSRELPILGTALVLMTLIVLVFPALPFIALVAVGWLAFAFELGRFVRQRRSQSA